MMGTKSEILQLPFSDSPITSSTKVSFAYSILKANMGDSFNKFLLHKFISYYYDKDMEHERFSFSREDLWGYREEITTVQDVDLLKETYSKLQFDFDRFISVNLESNIYVFGKFDRSVFDKSFAYSKDAVDYYLVTGCDRSQKTLILRYFDINRCCQCREIEYETFYTSVFNVPFERVKFYLIQFCNHEEYEINNNLIISAFESYIQSIESKLIKIKNRVYGLEATNAFQQYVQESITGGNKINQEYILCFAEHKDLMLQRVIYLVENNFLPAQLFKEAKTVVEIKTRLLGLLYYYNLTLEKTAEAEIIALINQISNIEKRYLNSLVEELKNISYL